MYGSSDDVMEQIIFFILFYIINYVAYVGYVGICRDWGWNPGFQIASLMS